MQSAVEAGRLSCSSAAWSAPDLRAREFRDSAPQLLSRVVSFWKVNASPVPKFLFRAVP
jgi:hypothetical protein